MKYAVFTLAMMASFGLKAEALSSVVGTWKLSAITMDGQTIQCPGKLTLPPGTPTMVSNFAQCGTNETIVFGKKAASGTYVNNNLTVLGGMQNPKGYWLTNNIRNVGYYITFIDSALTNEPRSYNYSIAGDKNTLTISDLMTIPDSSGMNFMRSQMSLVFSRVEK